MHHLDILHGLLHHGDDDLPHEVHDSGDVVVSVGGDDEVGLSPQQRSLVLLAVAHQPPLLLCREVESVFYV